MSYHIDWSEDVKSTFSDILNYLHEEWGVSSVEKFMLEVDNTVEAIKLQPNIVRALSYELGIRTQIVTKQNSLIYQVDQSKEVISLVAFWDTRQHPIKKKKYLE